ncbi:hypothetical protein G9A89_000708, partial [Geosiphon pyriformis]
ENTSLSTRQYQQVEITPLIIMKSLGLCTNGYLNTLLVGLYLGRMALYLQKGTKSLRPTNNPCWPDMAVRPSFVGTIGISNTQSFIGGALIAHGTLLTAYRRSITIANPIGVYLGLSIKKVPTSTQGSVEMDPHVLLVLKRVSSLGVSLTSHRYNTLWEAFWMIPYQESRIEPFSPCPPRVSDTSCRNYSDYPFMSIPYYNHASFYTLSYSKLYQSVVKGMFEDCCPATSTYRSTSEVDFSTALVARIIEDDPNTPLMDTFESITHENPIGYCIAYSHPTYIWIYKRRLSVVSIPVFGTTELWLKQWYRLPASVFTIPIPNDPHKMGYRIPILYFYFTRGKLWTLLVFGVAASSFKRIRGICLSFNILVLLSKVVQGFQYKDPIILFVGFGGEHSSSWNSILAIVPRYPPIGDLGVYGPCLWLKQRTAFGMVPSIGTQYRSQAPQPLFISHIGISLVSNSAMSLFVTAGYVHADLALCLYGLVDPILLLSLLRANHSYLGTLYLSLLESEGLLIYPQATSSFDSLMLQVYVVKHLYWEAGDFDHIPQVPICSKILKYPNRDKILCFGYRYQIVVVALGNYLLGSTQGTFSSSYFDRESTPIMKSLIMSGSNLELVLVGRGSLWSLKPIVASRQAWIASSDWMDPYGGWYGCLAGTNKNSGISLPPTQDLNWYISKGNPALGPESCSNSEAAKASQIVTKDGDSDRTLGLVSEYTKSKGTGVMPGHSSYGREILYLLGLMSSPIVELVTISAEYDHPYSVVHIGDWVAVQVVDFIPLGNWDLSILDLIWGRDLYFWLCELIVIVPWTYKDTSLHANQIGLASVLVR